MIHRFLDFELDEGRFELRRSGQLVALQARVFKLIAYLLQHRQRMVTKRELIASVWEGTIVTETAISQVVMLARKALTDEDQRVIKTVRGQGLRFVAEVSSASGATVSVPAKPTGAAAPLAAPMIGRERELAELLGHVERASRGSGALVLIEGDPGVGKSRLVEELASRTVGQGGVVFWGKAWEEGAPPFWPWIQVLRGLIEQHGLESLQMKLGHALEHVLKLLPERNEPSSQFAGTLALDADGSHARFRLFDAMSRLLRAVCTSSLGVRLIVLEDLHLLDEASVQLLRFVSQDVSDLPLLLLGSYRSLQLHSHKALSVLLGNLPDAGHTLQLVGLSESEARALVERRLGSLPASRWVGLVHQLSLGNPLLIEELARRASSHGAAALLELSELTPFALPERISHAVQKHLAELPPLTRDILFAASALGREFALPVLSSLLSLPEHELLLALGPALERDVIRVSPRSAYLTFSHALVRSAAYYGMAHMQRSALHLRIGELLEQLPSAHPPLHELAHHFYLAAAAGSRTKAITYARAAADHAWELMAYEAAADLYDRACELSQREAAEQVTLHDLLLRAGDAWYRAGELEQACARFDRAANLARAAGDAERQAWAVALSAYVMRGSMLHDRARQEQLREAVEQLPAGDSVIKAMLLGVKGLGTGMSSSLSERDATTSAAVEMARRVGDETALAWALHARHLTLWGLAHPADLRPLASELITLNRKNKNYELLLDSLLWFTIDSMALGDLPAVLRNRAEHLSVLERRGSPFHRYIALMLDAAACATFGNLVEARVFSNRACELGCRLHDPLAMAFHQFRTLHFYLLDTSQAEAPPSDPPADLPRDYHLSWALLWLREGRLDRVQRATAAFVSGGLDQPMLDVLRLPTWAVLGELCVASGQIEVAARLYPLLLSANGQHLSFLPGVYIGPVSYYLGILAEAMGDIALSARHFAAALEQASAVGAVPYQRRARAACERVGVA